MLFSDIPANVKSSVYKEYQKQIPAFPNEAVYIYSIKDNKLLYTQGWCTVLGYEDDEITLQKITSSTSKKHIEFTKHLNIEGLKFLKTINKDIGKYSITVEIQKIHKDGSIVPVMSKIGVHKICNGAIQEIIGITQIAPSLKFGKVIKYAAYGPEKSKFEETLNTELFQHLAISKKEKEALKMASEGFAFKEIANELNVSQSAIEKRIIPLYKRFNVKSLPHLISFAYKNDIL